MSAPHPAVPYLHTAEGRAYQIHTLRARRDATCVRAQRCHMRAQRCHMRAQRCHMRAQRCHMRAQRCHTQCRDSRRLGRAPARSSGALCGCDGSAPGAKLRRACARGCARARPPGAGRTTRPSRRPRPRRRGGPSSSPPAAPRARRGGGAPCETAAVERTIKKPAHVGSSRGPSSLLSRQVALLPWSVICQPHWRLSLTTSRLAWCPA